MTEEGVLARGKANYDAGKFLDNIETLAYVATLPKEDAPKEEVPKEAKKNVKSSK